MREFEPLKIPNALVESAQGGSSSSSRALAAVQQTVRCRVRVSPNGYLNTLFFLSFVAGLLAYFESVWLSLILFLAAWTLVPVLYLFDQIEFDGKSLWRRGPMAFLQRAFKISSARLKIDDIEHVETQTLRTLRSGGRVFYRYRTQVSGDNANFTLVSGGRPFRQMIRQLFARITEEKLDTRSLELRNFMIEPADLEKRIAEVKLPSADVLENTLPKLRRLGLRRQERQSAMLAEDEDQDSQKKALHLRQIANELRISGNLSQALEAFRRALLRQPENAALLHDFARGLYSYASASRSSTWTHRATAALRLAAHRSQNNSALLARIGESYFQFGSFDRAAKVFQQALELDHKNFRAECGLAEVALQNGKLAHVVHHYQAAVRIAPDAAAKRRAQTEADYFVLLNSNENYLEAEVSRLSWLQSAIGGKRVCFRLIFVGLITIAAGAFWENEVTALGWATASTAVLMWMILSIFTKFLAERISLDEVVDE